MIDAIAALTPAARHYAIIRRYADIIAISRCRVAADITASADDAWLAFHCMPAAGLMIFSLLQVCRLAEGITATVIASVGLFRFSAACRSSLISPIFARFHFHAPPGGSRCIDDYFLFTTLPLRRRFSQKSFHVFATLFR
jgi:hypothetical protein